MKNGQLPDRWFPARPKSVLNRVTDKRMSFDWSINPYRGCGHGCHFCYARATHRWLGFHADDSFRNNIYVKRDAASVLRSELKRGKWKGGDIAIGTATDPYQQLEGKLKITRSILEVLQEYNIPCSITTRSPLILRDLDLLKEMKITSIHISVSTLDREIWRKTEPSSPHPRQRMKTVWKLNHMGVPAGIFLAPIIPYLTDTEEQLRQVVDQAKQHGARFVVPSILRLTPEVKSWFFRQVQPAFHRAYPHLVRLYGEKAIAPDRYRDSLMKQVQRLAEEAGLSTRIPPYGGQESGAAIREEGSISFEPPEQLRLF